MKYTLSYLFFGLTFFGFFPNNAQTLDLNTSIISPTLIAQQGRTKRVQFAPGTTSTIIRNAVVRGTRDTYLLGAKRGQIMLVSIAAVENNAVFDIVSPNGGMIQQEAVSYSFVLPANGDYKIVVGGTRGNASYLLTVEIR